MKEKKNRINKIHLLLLHLLLYIQKMTINKKVIIKNPEEIARLLFQTQITMMKIIMILSIAIKMMSKLKIIIMKLMKIINIIKKTIKNKKKAIMIILHQCLELNHIKIQIN